MKHAISFCSLSFLSSTLLVILVLLALSACGRGQPLSATSTPAPTVTATAALAQSTATATPSATPTQTASQTPAESALTPTATLVPLTTPAAKAEAYRLQPWDRDTTLRMLQEGQDVPIPEEYEDIRTFYRVSLWYEAALHDPELQRDPEMLRDLARLKGTAPTYFSTYGLLHDHSVEPFRQLLENALNQGDPNPATSDNWILKYIWPFYDLGIETNHLFDQSTSTAARVIQIYANGDWGFFVIRSDSSKHFTVLALYPEWKRAWWSAETFKITDLNANGRYEIAITHDDWGTGMSHFCRRSFHLYEWDGAAFRDLMSDPLEVSQGTDYGNCMEITFPPNLNGGYKIQAGTTLNTLCPEMPYEHILRFAWNGNSFKKELDQTQLPHDSALPSRCTIDWALKAGSDNDYALTLLASALHNWPFEAEKDWGPAAQDYLRLKLGTWYLRCGELDRGLAQIRQVREHPAAPDYPLTARVAVTFLDTQTSQGWYNAVQAVDQLYQHEEESVCGPAGCNVEKMLNQWGFSEREWGIELNHFQNDFLAINPITLCLKQNPPKHLEELKPWLEHIGIPVAWVGESDMDGQDDLDWVAQVELRQRGWQSQRLIVFQRAGGEIHSLILNNLYKFEGTKRLQSYRPSPDERPITVFQSGTDLYAFRLIPLPHSKVPKFDMLLSTLDMSTYEAPANVKDWHIEAGKLLIQYESRQDQAIYTWNKAQRQLAVSGAAPNLQEEHVREAEQALYIANDPSKAIDTLNVLLNGKIWENYSWTGDTPPRLRPYIQYLLGLAYERSGDETQAVKAYWQLWYDYPANPYSLAAQSKLIPK